MELSRKLCVVKAQQFLMQIVKITTSTEKLPPLLETISLIYCYPAIQRKDHNGKKPQTSYPDLTRSISPDSHQARPRRYNLYLGTQDTPLISILLSSMLTKWHCFLIACLTKLWFSKQKYVLVVIKTKFEFTFQLVAHMSGSNNCASSLQTQ